MDSGSASYFLTQRDHLAKNLNNVFVAKKLPQFVAAGVATLGAFCLGNVLGWSSPSLTQIRNHEAFVDLHEDSHSWIGSLAPIGACCSGPVAGILIDKIGRKKFMMLLSPFFVAGWLMIAFAEHVELIFAGRFLTGFCGGSFSLAAPVYISETAEDSIRGTLGSSLQLMINCGVFFTYVVGIFIPWNWLAIACACIPVVFLILMFFMPESPRYLLTKGEKQASYKALIWLRGAKKHENVKQELESVQRSIEEMPQANLRTYIQPSILKPLLISLAMMFFQQWNGNNAVVFYTVKIFQDAGSTLDANIATIIVGGVQIVASILSSILMDKAGRRVLLVISGILMTIALIILGIYFYLKIQDPPLAETIGWLPLACLLSFIAAYSIGFGPIAWMVFAEILPLHIKANAAALNTSFNWLNAFIVTKVFDDIKEGIGIEWCFWIFGIAAGVGTIFVIIFVPETKGKSLDEIQQYFGGSNSPDTMELESQKSYF